MRTILGLSFGFHDAGASVVDYDTGEILYASHAERYSKRKNDPWLNKELIEAALSYGEPVVIAMYEDPWYKKLRHIRSGHLQGLLDPSVKKWLSFYPALKGLPVKYMSHHQSHIAGSWLTAPPASRQGTGVVIDAIGEMDTSSIWKLGTDWHDLTMKKVESRWYPDSLGLFYTAMTHAIDLTPMEDEYILMGMAAYGRPFYAEEIANRMRKEFFTNRHPMSVRKNLHRGVGIDHWTRLYDHFDVALATQMLFEEKLFEYMTHAKSLVDTPRLYYSGGCALNCSANTKLFELFDDVTIMPNPGDAGSSLGAAAAYFYKVRKQSVSGFTPYLGYKIEGDYPVQKALHSLEKGEVFGIANGRAEFGPRALGNRSLLADPRSKDIKDKVNEIKHRQKFRPFAPAILESELYNYFHTPQRLTESRYMQFTLKCKYPSKFPGIVHIDGTSRVQTVSEKDNPGLFDLLTRFYKKTGCPMLLNTSLNVKGQPIVNDGTDVDLFEHKYRVPVYTNE